MATMVSGELSVAGSSRDENATSLSESLTREARLLPSEITIIGSLPLRYLLRIVVLWRGIESLVYFSVSQRHGQS